jgi:hypothetical protein
MGEEAIAQMTLLAREIIKNPGYGEVIFRCDRSQGEMYVAPGMTFKRNLRNYKQNGASEREK